MGLHVPTAKLRPLLFGLVPNRASKKLEQAVQLNIQLPQSHFVLHSGAQGRHLHAAGNLLLYVRGESLALRNISAAIIVSVNRKARSLRNFKNHERKQNQLHDWCIANESTVLPHGSHSFSFSTSFPNNLPPSLNTSELQISYHLHITASWATQNGKRASLQCATSAKEVHVMPELVHPQSPPYISRYFQSADIGAVFYLDSLHADRTNRFTIMFEGLVREPSGAQSGYIWRMVKTAWSLNEVLKMAVAGSSEQGREMCRRLARGQSPDGLTYGDGVKPASLDIEVGLQRSLQWNAEFVHTSGHGALGDIKLSHWFDMELIFVKETIPADGSSSGMRNGIFAVLSLQLPVTLVGRGESQELAESLPAPLYEE
ncbi:hypothetical protein SCAR479_08053 [Seiridium cardinale]|uniref:LDB19 N-terminal domain-containing protein n=1 Tax=Seiridium cardinale TaxID=138064 RepID=A0ABR2XNK2_9PEZI